ncbi:tol-pal system-associated acyl-CoA thioesterase [Denitromonas ohlonensis]|uniref:Tol-pal system-associated acyl-CoA thioesterase n=2 Tax=Denitromonas TaxID=139331 RepID=A0A558EYN3_9RHOO|nr:tol-pal system-associated acyl-CoA thioesterase [Denitromonas ohlonensis]TVT45351.1 MAG: tol-pal system-associated acyl-CoA thioesterase [Denitromonas halophila]TVO68021.1 tol-pal system-associated acyl-CoA thioesterase [Denitromonas ohlonensis]TVO78074.1 tol-pal system-associated acyl-CoA thioesterase [Denitromonas ohlonensis]TVT69897.1 MAG: tol-pal system-associated acyl-CoA thioesterase [Denitromonas halophila]TVT78474.1 MAG: tol-pal system-associated acyl-CoA thioesterase [Denitromonas 
MLPTDPAAAIAPESLMVRVYYEDTDAAGVVYYANYWRFCERGRTEWLRQQGFDQQQLMDDTGIAFVVRRVAGEYLRPARLDDTLQVVTTVSTLKRASLSFSQKIWRDAELLFEATVSVACLDTKRNRAVAIPDTIRKTLTPGQPG